MFGKVFTQGEVGDQTTYNRDESKESICCRSVGPIAACCTLVAIVVAVLVPDRRRWICCFSRACTLRRAADQVSLPSARRTDWRRCYSWFFQSATLGPHGDD